MAVLLDNRTTGSVGDALVQHMARDGRLSMLTNAFSIYAFMSLKAHVDKLRHARILLPLSNVPSAMEAPLARAPFAFNRTAIGPPGHFRIPDLQGDVSDRRFRNGLNQARVAMETAQWIADKVEVRSLASPMPQNLFCIEGETGTVVIQGSSPFTNEGLGLAASAAPALNTLITDPAAARGMLQWFDDLWHNAELARDFKAGLLAQLKALYKERSPEHVY